MITFRNPQSVHDPVASYRHQAEISGQVRWLVLSGQIGKDQNSSVPEDPIRQLEIAMDNIIANLKTANMRVEHLVKLVFYLVGDSDPQKRREVIAEKLNGHVPCTTLLFVAGLAAPSLKVEIDAWACCDC